MSHFYCPHCHALCAESEHGYVTGCEHYPPELQDPGRARAWAYRLEDIDHDFVTAGPEKDYAEALRVLLMHYDRARIQSLRPKGGRA